MPLSLASSLPSWPSTPHLGRTGVRIARQTFSAAGIATRVAIDGEFYDVTLDELRALRADATPEQLELDPSECDEDC